MAKPTKSQQFSDFPAFTAATEKMNELKHERDRLGRDIQDMQDRRGAVLTGSARIASQAAAMLNADGGVAIAPDTTTSLEAVDALRQRRTVVLRAIEMQGGRITDIQSRISREIATRERPTYEAHLEKVRNAVAALSDALEEEWVFRDAMREAGVDFASVIPVCAINGMRLNEYGSRINQWAAEVERDYPAIPKLERRREPHAVESRPPAEKKTSVMFKLPHGFAARGRTP